MLKNRALPAVLLATLVCAAESGPAHAAAARPAPQPAAESAKSAESAAAPAADASAHAAPLSIPARVRSVPGTPSAPVAPDRKANPQSTNWAGYAITGGRYTSVAANWVEPHVTCTSDGIAGFWIGLDGWGSESVEQDGTGVDCTNGTPQQFAWWETYPENSIQVYNEPVAAGDRMSSEVVSESGGRYAMDLTDWTADWTRHNVVSAPTAQNASAEIIAEAVTNGSGITPLPDFGSIDFTDSTINGLSLPEISAQPVDMTDMANHLIATTNPADADGDFAVDYVGPTTLPADTSTGSGSTGHADWRANGRTALVARLDSLLASR